MIRKFKNIYHLIVASILNLAFMSPGKKIKVIGVTGTDGKTTTVSLIYHILKENGFRTSMLTSVGAYIADKEYDTGFHVTTPSSLAIQKLLKKAIKESSDYFVLEVTSHALDQHRVSGVVFEIGIITNVTNEHLDYHKNLENYIKTKEKLLKMAKTAIVNIDDNSYQLLKDAKSTKASSDWITYGFGESADVNLQNFKINSELFDAEFNKYNLLAAVACARKLGIIDEGINRSIKSFKFPKGRVDVVYDKDFKVIIDFAHTPNAIEKLLSSFKNNKGRVIHVFGSAGQRDREKRPVMGKASSKFSDIIILTAEDPRSEDGNKIIEEISKGIDNKDVKVVKIADRKQAIEAAINEAKKGDTVFITGKAHEKSMTYGKTDFPWDEYEVVLTALKNKK